MSAMTLFPTFSKAGHDTVPRPRAPRPAAGVLPRAVDTDGSVYVLLGRRARSLGGTWSNFGGSLHPGEDALAGALRELYEEALIDAADLTGGTVAAVIESGTETIPYTLFVLDVPPAAFDVEADLSWEHRDVMWAHVDAVASLDLHDGFRRAWEAMT